MEVHHMTDKQIAALKYLIAHSRDGSKLAKQLVWFLIDNSKNLTQPVSLSFVQDREGFSRDEISKLAHSADRFTSCNCDTFLNQIFDAMGSELCFSLHFGHYDNGTTLNNGGQFEGVTVMSYTFWLAEKSYGHDGSGKILTTTRQEIEAIDLNKPGLYPKLENQVPPYNPIKAN